MLKGKSRRLAALIAAVLLCLAAAAAEEFRLLQVGDSGEAVYQFKLRLYDLGYFSSQPTHSYFNELTEQRVKLFQKMNGLRQDGRATPELQALLFSDQAIDAAGRRVGEPSVSPEAPSPTPEPTVSPTAEPLSAESLLPSATPAQESPSEATFAPTQVPQGVPSPVPALGVVRGWDRQQGYQYVTLGSYPYEEDGTPRPVLWKVLGTENGQALLMSALILDTQQVMFSRESYYAAMEAHTFRRIKSFAESDLCAWMNGEMLDTLVGFGYLRDALVEQGAEVVMTRETHDVDISNQERAKMMNEAGVDLWLRIHCDGADNRSSNGIGLYVSKSNSIAEESYRAAEAILPRMVEATGAKGNGITVNDNYTGQNWSEVPCLMVEMGFMSNPEEDVKLNDPAYQALLVTGMVNGISDYIALRDRGGEALE